tara:strand:+ start:591 stop:1001 length:411 start_codon:yes stop_codon:yes gene_type:complete
VNSKISEKDKKNWEKFLSSDQKLPNKDIEQAEIQVKKTRTLDLHGKSLEEANQTIERFIKKSYEDRVQKLIIVTGKGIHSKNNKDPYVSKDLGILKYSIPDYLSNNSELKKMISNISEASIKDGGSGAFYIFLRKK